MNRMSDNKSFSSHESKLFIFTCIPCDNFTLDRIQSSTNIVILFTSYDIAEKIVIINSMYDFPKPSFHVKSTSSESEAFIPIKFL